MCAHNITPGSVVKGLWFWVWSLHRTHSRWNEARLSFNTTQVGSSAGDLPTWFYRQQDSDLIDSGVFPLVPGRQQQDGSFAQSAFLILIVGGNANDKAPPHKATGEPSTKWHCPPSWCSRENNQYKEQPQWSLHIWVHLVTSRMGWWGHTAAPSPDLGGLDTVLLVLGLKFSRSVGRNSKKRFKI